MAEETLDIIVVDDDPAIGELSRDLLNNAGYKVRLVASAEELLAIVGTCRPRALVLDMMMPGMDGMELLRKIRSDPGMKGVKIALVTAKAFPIERERAYQFGADLFIGKPYDVANYVNSVSALLGTPTQPAAPAAESSVASPKAADATLPAQKLKVKVWGARGFSPYLPNEKSSYGRQTSCVSVETPFGLFILDAGSGIIPLGLSLVKNPSMRGPEKKLWILLSHFHLDHIIGLGAFPCAHDPEFKISIGSANDADKDVTALLQDVFSGPLTSFYPPPQAQMSGYKLEEGSCELTPGVVLRTLYMMHPTTTLGFRLESAGKTVVYCSDNEWSAVAAGFPSLDKKLVAFCSGADLLIHDARYTDEDYERHKNQGHSGLSGAVELAGGRAGVKELVLFHLDPGYSDETLAEMDRRAQSLSAEKGWKLRCHMASEGLTIGL